MDTFDIYQDIMTRTGGDIYIGVVGPVRTGKSTFIRHFMENLIIPRIGDEKRRERVIDELPESADGRTIMTTEPKFVPDGGVAVEFGEGMTANVRLIDSVGYIVNDAEGYREGENDRYVLTPWSKEQMTFKDAGEYGTRKVITDHSTVGVVVLTDGSITGIGRDSYVESEERVIADLKDIGKPFVIVLNSANPNSDSAISLRDELEKKYSVAVILMSVKDMTRNDADNVLKEVLFEFPVTNIEVDIPSYMQGLDVDNDIMSNITANILAKSKDVDKMSDYMALESATEDLDCIDSIVSTNIDFARGTITYEIKAKDSLFYDVISSESGVDIKSDLDLVAYIKRLSAAEKIFDRIGASIDEVESAGYSIVPPNIDDVEVGEPTLEKKGGKCSVKISAKVPSLHIMKVDISADIKPIMGTEDQCNEMIDYIKNEAKDGNIMDVTLMNRTIGKMIESEIDSRSDIVSLDTRAKMVKTMSRIVNEGKGGVLCVLI